jgi:hypothetical protein
MLAYVGTLEEFAMQAEHWHLLLVVLECRVAGNTGGHNELQRTGLACLRCSSSNSRWRQHASGTFSAALLEPC